MQLCLVRLPSSFLINERAFPPLGLLAVGTALKLAGHEVLIRDGAMEDVPMDYEGYGFGPTTPEYAWALAIKDRIRQENPRARLVLGGSFAAINPLRCGTDGWDCVVYGDGEIEAPRAFTGKESFIVAREYDLDEYPISDRTLIDGKSYKLLLDGREATTVVSSRGCPWRCGFCCKTAQNNSVRIRSAEHVLREVLYLHSDFGYTAIQFPDDIFILDRKRVEEIAAGLNELGIHWRCLVRADLVIKYGQDFVHMMADCGCTDVGMGVESGSDRILAIAKKHQTTSQVRQAVAMMRQEGIRVKGFLILGLPGEDPESIAETEALLDGTRFEDVDIKIYQPYPGSPIWENKHRYDIDWNDMALEHQYYKGRIGDYHGNVRTSALTNADIVHAMNWLEAKYKRAG